MTLSEANTSLKRQLVTVYDERETAAITFLVLEKLTGLGKIDQVIQKTTNLSGDQEALFKQFKGELLSHRPVQYVLGETWFAGLKFWVNESVLIPRPETEELVQWVNEEISLSTGALSIFDIGTGSGCIAITLQKKWKNCIVHACDISAPALATAQKNAVLHNSPVIFHQMNFTESEKWKTLPAFDIIVSNPPYIPVNDKSRMSAHVINHEPALALFVPNDNPFLFYQSITDFAISAEKRPMKIFVEINDHGSEAIRKIFEKGGFTDIQVRKDMQGTDRMIKATLLL